MTKGGNVYQVVYSAGDCLIDDCEVALQDAIVSAIKGQDALVFDKKGLVWEVRVQNKEEDYDLPSAIVSLHRTAGIAESDKI
jgi:hypothetical protein